MSAEAPAYITASRNTSRKGQKRVSEQHWTIPAQVQIDDDGYFDRVCPSAECGQPFKVLFEDWENKVSDEVAYCPFCRQEATAQDFNTPEQWEYVKQLALAKMMGWVGEQLTGMAQDVNRRQPRGGLLSIRMNVSTPSVLVPLPPAAEEPLTLRITCEACGCRVAVIGAGFFCPACGHNSADQMFDQAVTKARVAMTSLTSIQEAISDRDMRAQVRQALMEAQIPNLVTAFSRFAEASYPRLPHPTQQPRRNAFQNLIEGERLWTNGGGAAYGSILNPSELDELKKLFQQRHLFEHQQGIVDQDYLAKSGDSTYALGQRLIIREAAVLRLADLVERLVGGMRRDLA